MPVRSTTAAEATAAARGLAAYDSIIDVRSPAEFADDHLPGAVNWPVLDDEQRRIVGTLYVQTSPLEARKVGAAMVARNIAAAIEQWVQDKPRDWQPLVYCWRGGQRSGSMAWFLDQVGFRTTKLDGGYKGFRAVVRRDLVDWPARFGWRVLAGRTGSGKTRLLHALATEGAQVLDLEGLAHHRGSVLGGWPDLPQPSQKSFDTQVWQALAGFDATRPVFVESESRKIGRLRLPEALEHHMHHGSQVLRVDMPDTARVQLLLEEYSHFASAPDQFCRLLDGLVDLRGRQTVAHWQALAQAGDWPAVFDLMMREHYDPLYQRSIDRHYSGFNEAPVLHLPDGSAASLQGIARSLL